MYKDYEAAGTNVIYIACMAKPFRTFVKLVKWYYTGIFYRIRNHMPYNIAIQMYYAFVHSRISYSIEVYGMAKSCVIKPLQIMQNRILKILTFKPRRFSTNLLHNSLGLLKVTDILYVWYTLRVSTLLQKYTKNIVPGLFNNIFNPISERSTNIRTQTNVFSSVSKQKYKYGQLMLNNYCYKLWQSTPLYVKNSSSLYMFKKEQKSLLLANCCNWIYFVYMA